MDIQSLMRQAQEMQRKMQKTQEDLGNILYDGTSGGGMVKVTVSGAGIAKKLVIDPSLINAEEKDILEDLIIAAFNDAKNKADTASSDSLKSLTGGLKLPPGFKL